MWMIWVVVVASISLASVEALTDRELKRDFTKIVMKCLKTHPVDKSEVKALQKLITPTKRESKCLLACAYRTEGTLNSEGMYDTDHAYKLAERAGDTDQTRVANAKKVADICSRVNDEEVSDGSDGCDRAALIYSCVNKNAPKYGFHV